MRYVLVAVIAFVGGVALAKPVKNAIWRLVERIHNGKPK